MLISVKNQKVCDSIVASENFGPRKHLLRAIPENPDK